MRKVIVNEFMSLDGVVQAPGKEITGAGAFLATYVPSASGA